MINHQEQFERLEGCFDSLSQTYQIFKKKQNKNRKEDVLADVKTLREQLYSFTNSIKNIYFR